MIDLVSFAYSFIFVAAVSGFALAFYIHSKKKAPQPMVCPIGHDCTAVVHSEYSRFIGIPLENLGMLYYGAIAIAYGLVLFMPNVMPAVYLFWLLGLSLAAFFFSCYLVFIQGYILRQWCTWCLISAGLSALIFFSALAAVRAGLVQMLADNYMTILILHFFGAALGVGGATITDIFFFKFVKDFKITEWEADILKSISQVIWLGLAIIVISGIGLYLPNADALNHSPKFLMEMLAVAIIIANGAALNLTIQPKLVRISFGHSDTLEAKDLLGVRKLAYALGSVSLVSWYTVFLLGALNYLPLNFLQLLGIYISAIAIAMIASQFAERSIAAQKL